MDRGKKIDNLFYLLRNSSHLLIQSHEKYSSLVNYLSGYELATDMVLGDKIPSFDKWLAIKEGKNFSSSWSNFILQKCKYNEDLAKETLINFFESYLEGNADILGLKNHQ